MAQLVIDPIKYINQLPNFDGNRDDLQNFCDLVDRVYPFLLTFVETAQPVFTDMLKSKLKDRAKLVIDINCQAVSWPEIKQILMNNFSDTKSCDELYDEMRNISFQTNCVDFYNALRGKLRRLNNKVLAVNGAGAELNQCSENNRRSALKLFISKIPEPMKSILICRDPDNLEEAMDILFKAGYAYYGREYTKLNQHDSKNNEQKLNHVHNKQNNHKTEYNRNENGNNRSNVRNGNNFNGNNNRSNSRHYDNYRQSNNYNRPNNFDNNYNRPNNFDNNYNSNRAHQYDQRNERRSSNFEQNSRNNFPETQVVDNQGIDPRNDRPLPEPMEIGHHEINVQLENFSINNSRSNLPFIVVSPEIRPLKFIIDTGATHSIINPSLCDDKWKTTIDKLFVKTLKHHVEINEKVRIPLFKELGDISEHIELFVCPFHEHFDGILGNNVLQQLKAKIDYESKQLVIGDKVAQIFFQNNPNEVNVFEKKSENTVKIPVLQNSGLVFKSNELHQDEGIEIKSRKVIQNGNANCLSSPVIHYHQISNKIIESQCAVNMYKNQIIVEKVNSGSLKIKNESVFNAKRKIVTSKTFDDNDALTLLNNHLQKNKTNAVFIENEEFFSTFSRIVNNSDMFENNNKFKIIRCKRFLKDVVDEEELGEMIKKEHLKNNHRGISENFSELRNEIYNPKLKNKVTEFINNCEICNVKRYKGNPVKQKFNSAQTPSKPKAFENNNHPTIKASTSK